MATMAGGGMSPAGQALGLLGGISMADQAGGETEEERRKRLLAANAAKLLPKTGLSPAGQALWLGYGGVIGGGY